MGHHRDGVHFAFGARAVGETAGPQRCIALLHITSDWVEPERAPRVEMGNVIDLMGKAGRRVVCSRESSRGVLCERGSPWICRLLVSAPADHLHLSIWVRA